LQNWRKTLDHIEAKLQLTQTVLAQVMNALHHLVEVGFEIRAAMDTFNTLKKRIEDYEKEN
jgi:hypothetical protein